MRSRKFNKIYKIQPREKTGRIWVVGFFVLIFCIFVSCSECCSTESSTNFLLYLASQLINLAIPLIPLHFAIYLVNFHKAGYQLAVFNKLFQKVSNHTKAFVSVLVMSIFLLVFLNQDTELVNIKLLNLGIQCFAAITVVILLEVLKVQRNTVEDETVVERAKQHIAPGLAMAYFRYIQNVVHGVVDDHGNVISLPHEEALRDYVKENEIESDLVWISEKILILFPESEHIRGSVRDISDREREKGENHCLTLEPIIHEYEISGQPRKSVLDVIKIQDNQTTTYKRCGGKCNKAAIGSDRTRTNQMNISESPLAASSGGLCEKLHEKKEWQNNYVIFAENRPLNTLYQMVDTPGTQISFERGDFELQFKLYLEELRKLIEEDEVCRDKVELFRYRDYESKEGNFSKQLKNQIKKMKMGSKTNDMQ